MSCCSNSFCQTSVKLLATFAFQRITCAQEHWAAVTQDFGLHTWPDVASRQTKPQFCRLQITERHSGMCLSETASDVKHRWWVVVINRMIFLLTVWHYISQGRVEAPIRISGQLCYSSVANLLQYLFAKKLSKYNAVGQTLLHKIKWCNFFASQCRFSTLNVTAIFRRGPPNGASNEGRVWKNRKIGIFDQYLASSRVDNGATVRCCKHSVVRSWQAVVTLIGGVCAQHSRLAIPYYYGHLLPRDAMR